MTCFVPTTASPAPGGADSNASFSYANVTSPSSAAAAAAASAMYQPAYSPYVAPTAGYSRSPNEQAEDDPPAEKVRFTSCGFYARAIGIE